MIGCRRSNSGTGANCSRAVSEPNRIPLLGNTLASSMPGSRVRGSTVRPTAHIQCAGQRRRRSTERRVTFERFSCCSDIRSSKAPSGISGSRSMTLSASLSRSNSDDLRGPATGGAARTGNSPRFLLLPGHWGGFMPSSLALFRDQYATWFRDPDADRNHYWAGEPDRGVIVGPKTHGKELVSDLVLA